MNSRHNASSGLMRLVRRRSLLPVGDINQPSSFRHRARGFEDYRAESISRRRWWNWRQLAAASPHLERWKPYWKD